DPAMQPPPWLAGLREMVQAHGHHCHGWQAAEGCGAGANTLRIGASALRGESPGLRNEAWAPALASHLKADTKAAYDEELCCCSPPVTADPERASRAIMTNARPPTFRLTPSISAATAASR